MLSPKDQEAYLQLQNHYAAEFEAAGIDVNADPEGELPDPIMDPLVDTLERQLDREIEPIDFPDVPLPKKEVGFWASDEEEDEFTQVEDGEEEWDDNAITSVAQSELDLHREIREYTRVIAWDMPLLQSELSPSLSAIQKKKSVLIVNVQNSSHRSNPPQKPRPSASATQPTWANTTLQRAKSSCNSARRTSPI